MNTIRIRAALGASLMLAATLASAQPGPRGDDDRRGRPQQQQQQDQRHDDRRGNDFRGNDRRGDDRRFDDRRGPDHRNLNNRGPGPVADRGVGPDFRYHRGDRLPPQYRDRQYVVDDWRGHRLSAPPRGYHWVQSGGDYVLVAIATGVIATILLNH